MKPKSEAIILLSGGIDSTVLLYELTMKEVELHCLIFDYGQSLFKEIDYARNNCNDCNQKEVLIELELFDLIGKDCALLNPKVKIPVGRKLKEINKSVPTTYVPFRNGIFLSYAVAYGEAHGIENIFAGSNGLNSGQYYDDTVHFADSFAIAARAGTSPGYNPTIVFPYARFSKKDIAERGRKEWDINFSNTWSCYKNGKRHCGYCDSCVQRKIALGELYD